LERVCKEEASKYIENVEEALRQLNHSNVASGLQAVIEQAKLYLKDAQFYLNRGDCITSIACSSYAEGLLDALRFLGLAEFQWKSGPAAGSAKKVLVGGVFDILHPGHIFFLRKAGEYGRVYVVVARDQTVLETKGHLPIFSEGDRVEILNSLKIVEEAFLGDYPPNFENAIRRVNPDYIVLGSDQERLVQAVEKAIDSLGVDTKVVVLKERIEGYSSTFYRDRLRSYYANVKTPT